MFTRSFAQHRASQHSEAGQLVENLARDWERRTEVRLRGPMAAYGFAGNPGLEG